MDNIAPDPVKVASSIAALRERWLDAVKTGDVEEIAAMVADDVVVVHGNGRCIRGKDALKADFINAFEAYSITQSASHVEVIVRGIGLLKSRQSKRSSPRTREEKRRRFSPSRLSDCISNPTDHGK